MSTAFGPIVLICNVRSGRGGVGKALPDVTAELGINPAEALFIDDSPENIARAEIQGVRTIVFKNERQFFRKLKELLG